MLKIRSVLSFLFMNNLVKSHTLFTDYDIYLFRQGKHFRLYEKFGSHEAVVEDEQGVYFAVWAPNAKNVSVIGTFNNWLENEFQLFPRWDESGIWEGFIPNIPLNTVYKYAILTPQNTLIKKGDPYSNKWENTPEGGSIVCSTWYAWNDENWMEKRHQKNSLQSPFSVYEMHIASWMRGIDEPDIFFNYREVAERLIPYLKEMNFTHVEFMPVMEYPYDPSWGYQITGFYAASSRFGSPQDLMFLIDELHQNDIGVILDWVPSHFPGDAHGLYHFDGVPLYEYADRRKGFHPEWNSYIFDYGRNEVRSFLISNACFWLERYHADGLRVDAVTSMLHLDYARNTGEWEPNIFGGNVNLEAKSFLQELNTTIYREFPDVQTIAEESSDFPKLTKPVHEDGIGFGMKWMMGWMHDTLKYFKEDPIYRKFNHHKITFTGMYMFNENYMMPLSHDEVVHGKASLIYKMKGDEWQKFANLRALFTYMYTFPGAKLLFMGGEFGQTNEWKFRSSLDWHLLKYPIHKGLQNFVKKINFLYSTEKALFEQQFSPDGFEWIVADDIDNSVFIYLRKGKKNEEVLMTVLNLTPQVIDYQLGIDKNSKWEVLLNSDEEEFSGSGLKIEPYDYSTEPFGGKENSMMLKLPALSGIVLKLKTTKNKSKDVF